MLLSWYGFKFNLKLPSVGVVKDKRPFWSVNALGAANLVPND